LLPLASSTEDIPSLSLAFSKARYASSNNRSLPELFFLRCEGETRKHCDLDCVTRCGSGRIR
jgi:hypothetical protein